MPKRPGGGAAGARFGAPTVVEGFRRPQADHKLEIAGGGGENEN